MAFMCTECGEKPAAAIGCQCLPCWDLVKQDGGEAYELGNCLRGMIAGYFRDDQAAWDQLGRRFDAGYPSENGRGVILTKVVRRGDTLGGAARPHDMEKVG